MNVANTIKKLGLEQAFDYLYKDPENNLLIGRTNFPMGNLYPNVRQFGKQ